RFPGAVVMTSNCLMDPFENHYQHRLFTSGPVGWPGVTHIRDGDFGPAIAAALTEPGFAEDQIEQYITNGFARNTVMSVAGTVVDAVKRGDIRHFFVIGGCDGANPGRNYYTDFAEQAPMKRWCSPSVAASSASTATTSATSAASPACSTWVSATTPIRRCASPWLSPRLLIAE